jgi:hypothetical protein
MELKHVVVDGSNIATEGRSLPSLKQLDEAVRAFLAENPTEHVTVIVDATFGHRIDASERAEYEEAILAGELITPPAGAIGRGDKFVLQIADRADAAILSNDSFQEFHGEYTWLFDEGRLIGGKPVPGVGWVFLLRTPVRGPTSRRSVRDARAGTSSDAGGRTRTRGGRRRKIAAPEVAPGPASAVSAASAAAVDAMRTSVAPINDPLPFIEFVANHPIGSHVEGEVERFASHGAYIRAGGARCYLGLKFMGEPAPRSAKDVLNLGESRMFAVHAFDTPRRGIDLALVAGPATKPAAVAADTPAPPAGSDDAPAKPARRSRKASATTNATDQERVTGARADNRTSVTATVTKGSRDSKPREADREGGRAPDAATARGAVAKAPTASSPTATKTAADDIAQEAPVTPVKKAVAKRAPAKKKAVAKRAPAKKAVAKKATTVRKAAVKKAAVKKAPAKKAVAKKATAKKATAKRAPAKKAVAKKATAKRAPAKKAVAKKAVAKRATTVRKAAVKKAAVKKAPARKTAAARTTTARVAAVRKTATKATAKRAATKRAPAKRASSTS